MSITSTGLYGASTIVNTDLFDDVEKLKTDVTNLTTSVSQNISDIDQLQTTTDDHETRIDTLESDNTTNKSNIQTLQTTTDDHETRIDTLESDNTNNQSRLDTLEQDIIDLETNKQDKLQDISDTEILAIATYTDDDGTVTQVTTTKGDFENFKYQISILESDTNTIEQIDNEYALNTFYNTPYPVPYLILDAYCQLMHEHSITLKEQFEPDNHNIKHLTEVIQYIIQEHEIRLVSLEFFQTLTEAKALAKYTWMAAKVAANKFGKKIVIKLFPSLATKLGLDYQDMTDLTDKTLEEVVNELDDFFEIYKYENDLLGNKAAIKVTNLYLSQDINNIKVGTTITSGLDGLTVTGGKALNEYLDIKDNHPIERINNLIQLKYNTSEFKTGPSPAYNLELKMVPGNKVDIFDNAPLGLNVDNKLMLKYDVATFMKGSAGENYELQLKDDGVKAAKIDIVANRPLYKNGTQLDIRYDTNEFQTNATTRNLEIKSVPGNKIDMIEYKPVYNTATNKVDFRFNTTEFEVASSTDIVPYGLQLKSNGIKANKIDIADNRPIYNNNNKLDFRFDTTEFEVDTTSKYFQLKNDGIKATKLKLTGTSLYSDGANNLTVKLSENGGLAPTSIGIKVNLPTSSGLQTDATGLKINLPTTSGLTLGTDGLKVDVPTLSGLKIDATGLKIDLDTVNGGLAIDSGGLGISSTYKSEY